MKREDQDLTSPVGAKRRCSSSDFTSSSPVMTSSDQLSDQKTIKYDRQLRLWGDHGQTALEKAKICLIGATATGTEILKNLVLPGLGSFCIVDHALVKAGDLGNNFFVTAQDIGQSRAEAATRLLLEMNGDVQGEYLMEPIESLIENRPKFFQHFTVVITADLACEKVLQSLGKILWAAGIPLVVCRAFGLVGSIRLVCQEHLVTEAKPDNFIQDLRLEDPFPELMALRNEFDFRTMGKKAHSHVPYVIVLLAFLERWKTIQGALPISYKDKLKFREFVDEGRWKNEDGVPLTEENFDEACKAVVKTIGILKVEKTSS
jgi:NEDD8-activating enzyme E1 regulatory subunit